jgi:hypothetical protein
MSKVIPGAAADSVQEGEQRKRAVIADRPSLQTLPIPMPSLPSAMVPMIVIVIEGEAEERNPEAITGVPIIVIVVVIACATMPVPATPPAKPFSAVPAMDLLDQAFIHLWQCSITGGHPTGQWAG